MSINTLGISPSLLEQSIVQHDPKCSVLDVWVKREGWRDYWSLYHNAVTSLCNQQNIPLFILENEIYSVHLRNDRSLSDLIRTCDVCNSTYVGEKRTKPDESRQVPKFVRAFFMQIISIFGFKFAVIWKLPNTQETQPKMVKEAWNCDRKVQRTTYMHFVALLKFAIIYAFVKILNMYLLIKIHRASFSH